MAPSTLLEDYRLATSWEAEQAGMSCVHITHAMATLLVALRSWPDVNLEALRVMPEWKLAREWGWIMESGELSGSGHRHAGREQPAGIVK